MDVIIPLYFSVHNLESFEGIAEVAAVLAKMTSKNQLTLPKAVTAAVESTDYFDVAVENGRIILTPVRVNRANGVRSKLAELGLTERDISDAIAWARTERQHQFE